MAAPKGRITSGPDLLAYVLAHAAGFAFAFMVNPMIFRSLIAQGYRAHVLLAAIGLSIATSAVVLLLFLLLRKLIAGSAAPPPADKPAPPENLTDLPEIGAYAIAHAAGIAWNAIVTPLIFRALIAQGRRDLQLAGIALSITVSIAVLLIFLALRKAMRPAS